VSFCEHGTGWRPASSQKSWRNKPRISIRFGAQAGVSSKNRYQVRTCVSEDCLSNGMELCCLDRMTTLKPGNFDKKLEVPAKGI
jgi:hypothetical protein